MAPKQGTKAYLRFDSPSRGRVLEPGIVEAVADDSWTLAFEARHHAVETGEQKFVYYNRAREFFQQPVLIEAQSSEGPPFALTVKAVGEAVSADSRSEPRVEVADCGLEAMLDDEPHCPIQDVSLSGVGVIASRTHHVGQPLEIAFSFAESEYVGEVEVQAATPLPDGRTRYGLLGVFDTAQGRALKTGLTRMTLEVQNRRLQRMSGSSS